MSATADQRLDDTKADLLSPAERAAFEAQFGQLVGPIIDAKLDAKARELMASQADRWRQVLHDVAGPEPEHAARLVSREQAAKLLDVSLSTVKRMEERGELPEPIKFNERVVRHRLVDIEKVARG
jgi:predicted DNA-binding transcriptional regulator AlpA